MTAALVILGDGGEELGAGLADMEDSSSDIPGGDHDLGNGHRMSFSSEQFRRLLHSEEVVTAITGRADGVTNECNATKKKKRALYETLVQNEEWTTRARAFTRPANVDARYDDAMNSTMLKAAANAPNDPKMGGDSAPGSDEGQSGGEDFGGDDDAAAAEAADVAADVAEIAVVAL